MATQILHDAVTEDVALDDATSATQDGPCTVWVSGDLRGGTALIYGAATDDTDDFVYLGRLDQADAFYIGATGTYYVRVVLTHLRPDASVTAKSTQ